MKSGERNLKVEKEFLSVYDAHADALFRYCWRRVYNRELARELMQEAFTKSWQYLAEGKQVKNLKAFVYHTATNLIIDHHRKKKDESLEAMEEGAHAVATAHALNWNDVIDAKALLKKIEEIDEPYREALRLRYIDELTPKEIAAICGESVNVISVRITRAKKQFLLLVKDIV